MKTSTGKAKKVDELRFAAMKEIGCLCCLLHGHPNVPGEVHHLTSRGRRIGHQATLFLCPGHHRGVDFPMPYNEWKKVVGPSYALDRKEFREDFGEDTLLLSIQNELIRPILAAWAGEYT